MVRRGFASKLLSLRKTCGKRSSNLACSVFMSAYTNSHLRAFAPYRCTSLPHRTRENTNPRLTQRTGHATLSSVRVHQSAASAQLKKNSDPTPGKVKKSASVTLLTEMRGVCVSRIRRPLSNTARCVNMISLIWTTFWFLFTGPTFLCVLEFSVMIRNVYRTVDNDSMRCTVQRTVAFCIRSHEPPVKMGSMSPACFRSSAQHNLSSDRNPLPIHKMNPGPRTLFFLLLLLCSTLLKEKKAFSLRSRNVFRSAGSFATSPALVSSGLSCRGAFYTLKTEA